MNEVIGVALTLLGAACIMPHLRNRHETRQTERKMPAIFSRATLASLTDRELIRYADDTDPDIQRELADRLEVALDIIDAIKERTKPEPDQHECCF